MRTSQVNNESQWNRTIRITNNSVPGGLRWQHRRGPEHQKAQPRRVVSRPLRWPPPYSTPQGHPHSPHFQGSHPCSLFRHGITYTKQKRHVSLGSEHRRQGPPAGSTLFPHPPQSPVAPLQAPEASRQVSTEAPRDRRAQRLPGTGEHRGFRGQVSTAASGDR